MTLPDPNVVGDPATQIALDEIRKKFPLGSADLTGVVLLDPPSGAEQTIDGSIRLTGTNYLKAGVSAGQSDDNDGKIGTDIFDEGLNIVGVETDGTYRKVKVWGEIDQNQNDGTNNFLGASTFAGAVSAGSYTDALNVEAESSLKVIRGRASTTTPSVLQGSGFTVSAGGGGGSETVVTFSSAFSAIPAIVCTSEWNSGNQPAWNIYSVGSGAFTFWSYNWNDGTSKDTEFHFIAIGPR
jgi:hypothetical protein